MARRCFDDLRRCALALALILVAVFGLPDVSARAEQSPKPAEATPASPAGSLPAPAAATGPPPARDDSLEAAFGLRWFDSKAEVEALGVDLSHPTPTQFGDSYAVSYLPRNVPDMNYAVLSFGYNDQLIRITAVGGEYDNDNEARQIMARYRELQDVLEKKYGKGKSDSYIDKTYSGGMTAIGFFRKINWTYTVYDKARMRIELSVIAVGPSQTRWRLIFENLDGMAQLERHLRRSEEAAF